MRPKSWWATCDPVNGVIIAAPTRIMSVESRMAV